MRSVFQWNLGTRSLELGKRTVALPIDGQTVNVDLLYTPTQPGDRHRHEGLLDLRNRLDIAFGACGYFWR